MKVFITGGSGFIGTRIIPLLVSNGHEVIGLSRSETSDKILNELGCKTTIRGKIEDSSLLEKTASTVDAVIHLAFNLDGFGSDPTYDYFKESIVASEAILHLAKGLSSSENKSKDKILINTSGILGGAIAGFNSENLLSEKDIFETPQRPDYYSKISIDYPNLKNIVIRLSPIVYGKGEKGFLKNLILISKLNGFVGYLNQGLNKWTSIHVNDAAEIYVKALEKNKETNIYHALSSKDGFKIKDLSITLSGKLNLPLRSIETSGDGQESIKVFGPFISMVLPLDIPASNDLTREKLGWEPKELDLLDELNKNDFYFA
ncbi:uncharacterized protein L201_001400 [Kwoniella dendrophila CBS 6074]|uniref:NAD-dependent epimerase/dehydratase domain-containing protein n=1 Tax=Kwoniella dendrophila CBS 6074 TaxID=1295534 RepID=A0AAX4JNR8_9TREE